MEIEILHAFSPLLVVAWDQSGSLPQTPEWYQATLTGPLVSVGGCRALSESVYPPYCACFVHVSLIHLFLPKNITLSFNFVFTLYTFPQCTVQSWKFL